ncbi:MAG: GNAT family N-acetyltransferase [Candidatus Asgardarchaeia archaeon]
MDVKVRFAQDCDKDFVLEYTKHTWEHGDYIPEVWDVWIKDTAGKFFVAIVDGKPVGILHVSFLTSEIAWLEGARVHPKFRGKGIGSRLTEAAVNWCTEKGIKLVGFTTADDNIPAHRVAEKLNFSLKGRWYFAGLDLEQFRSDEKNKSSNIQFANTVHFEDILVFLSNDEGFLKVGKEYMRIFESFPLTSEFLLTKIHEGKVILSYDNLKLIDAVGIYDFSRNWEDNKLMIYFGLLTGFKKGILNIIKYIFSLYEEHKLKRFSLRLPVTEETKNALENLPLRKEPRIFRVYERYL